MNDVRNRAEARNQTEPESQENAVNLR